MTTQDADPLGPGDSLPEPPQLAGPELDAYGVPVQPHATRDYRRALAALVCAIVPWGLALPFLIGRHKPSNLLLLGAIPAFAATYTGGKLKEHSDRRTRRIAKAAFLLGVLGFFAVVLASGHGAALNDAP